jgi:putative transposase
MADRTAWRLCNESGIISAIVKTRKRRGKKPGPPVCDDLVNRNFTAAGPNQLWVTDITEDSTRECALYAWAVLDVFSRKAVGWALDRRAETSLVNSALVMAHSTRQPAAEGIIHADHETQFTAWAFTSTVKEYGLRLSCGTVGDCYDNAIIAAFWGRMQTELLDRKKWATIFEQSTEIADYIDTFHNHQCRHAATNVSPAGKRG